MTERRAFTPEDVTRLQIASDAQISPDGGKVAYTVAWADTEKDEMRSAVWLAPSTGGEPRRFTQGPKRDSLPRWSPDGSQIAFLRDDGEKPQIFVMPATGGEARRLTNIEEGAGVPVWSPDGKQIAFVARVGDEREPKEKEAKERQAKQPVEINAIKYKFDVIGHFRGRRPQIFLVRTDGDGPNDATQLTKGPYDSSMPVWSPDGARVAFVSTRHEERDFDAVSDIYVVDAVGGEPQRLTPSAGPSAAPSWSPDGSRIAYAGSEYPVGGFDGRNLSLWSVSSDPNTGGEPQRLTRDFDASISAMQAGGIGVPLIWSKDGSEITFGAIDRGASHLFRVPAGGGNPRKVFGGEERSVLSASATPDGEHLAAVISRYDTPSAVIVVSASGSDERQLTHLNEALFSSLRLSEPERLSFQGTDGGEFEGWLIRPIDAKPGERAPLLLDVHGGPHGAWGPGFSYAMPFRQALAGQGWAILYINPRGSGSYGDDFATYIKAGWGERDFPDFMAAVDRVVEMGIADPERLAVTGVSYGGYMTNWIVGHTDRFKAAVSEACVSNLVSFYGTADIGSIFFDHQFEGPWWEQLQRYLKLSPISYVDRITTPMLFLHNEGDLRCPIAQSEEMFVALRRQRKPVQFVRFPGGFHGGYLYGPPSHHVEHDQRLIAWVNRWVLGAEPATKELTATAADA